MSLKCASPFLHFSDGFHSGAQTVVAHTSGEVGAAITPLAYTVDMKLKCLQSWK